MRVLLLIAVLMVSTAHAGPDNLEIHPGEFPEVTAHYNTIESGAVNVRYALDPNNCYQLRGDDVPESARQIERLAFYNNVLTVNGVYVMSGQMIDSAFTGGFNVSFRSPDGKGYKVTLSQCFTSADSFEDIAR